MWTWTSILTAASVKVREPARTGTGELAFSPVRHRGRSGVRRQGQGACACGFGRATVRWPVGLTRRNNSEARQRGPVMRPFWSLCSFTLLIGIAAGASPQTPPEKEKEKLSGNAAKAAEFAAAEAVRYDMRHTDEKKAALKLLSQPVLRWSNPLRGEIHGSVYLWTRDGCPEVAA